MCEGVGGCVRVWVVGEVVGGCAELEIKACPIVQDNQKMPRTSESYQTVVRWTSVLKSYI